MADNFKATKDPDEKIDFGINWATWLESDTISASTWVIVPSGGIVVDSESETSTVATVWLTGGKTGTTYKVRNFITTAAGRSPPRTIHVKVMEK